MQRMAPGNETVMAVGRRKGRQESERLAAPVAEAAANSDPIMLFIMRLFAAAAMTDDGVLGTNRAAAQDDFCAGLGPIDFEVVLRRRKWDKQNRTVEGFARPLTMLKMDRRCEALPPKRKLTWKKNNA